jgi:hypothetical protein
MANRSAVHRTLEDAHNSLIVEGNRIGFVLQDVARDGNCLYSSLKQHPDLTLYATSTAQLRRNVVEILKRTPNADANFIANNEGYGTPHGGGYATWNDYLNAIEVTFLHQTNVSPRACEPIALVHLRCRSCRLERVGETDCRLTASRTVWAGRFVSCAVGAAISPISLSFHSLALPSPCFTPHYPDVGFLLSPSLALLSPYFTPHYPDVGFLPLISYFPLLPHYQTALQLLKFSLRAVIIPDCVQCGAYSMLQTCHLYLLTHHGNPPGLGFWNHYRPRIT